MEEIICKKRMLKINKNVKRNNNVNYTKIKIMIFYNYTFQ